MAKKVAKAKKTKKATKKAATKAHGYPRSTDWMRPPPPRKSRKKA